MGNCMDRTNSAINRIGNRYGAATNVPSGFAMRRLAFSCFGGQLRYLKSAMTNTGGGCTSKNMPPMVSTAAATTRLILVTSQSLATRTSFRDLRWKSTTPRNGLRFFAESGARYIVPVAEMHDGYAMYASKHTRWNVVDVGPKRDVMRLLVDSARKKNLKVGLSSHFAWNRVF